MRITPPPMLDETLLWPGTFPGASVAHPQPRVTSDRERFEIRRIGDRFTEIDRLTGEVIAEGIITTDRGPRA